jgi:hypothetical protein
MMTYYLFLVTQLNVLVDNDRHGFFFLNGVTFVTVDTVQQRLAPAANAHVEDIVRGG